MYHLFPKKTTTIAILFIEIILFIYLVYYVNVTWLFCKYIYIYIYIYIFIFLKYRHFENSWIFPLLFFNCVRYFCILYSIYSISNVLKFDQDIFIL